MNATRRQPWRTMRCSSACRIPGVLVDEQAGDRRRGDRHAGERQRRQPRAQLGHGRRAEEVAQRAAHQDDAVGAGGVAQVEDEVAVDAVAARRAQHAAGEHRDVDVAPVGGVGDPRQHGGLVRLAQRIDQHADARPLAAPAVQLPRPGRATRVGPLWSRQRIPSIGNTRKGSPAVRVSLRRVRARSEAAVAARDGDRNRRAVRVDLSVGARVAHRTHRQAQAEEIQILQGVRKVCKLATVELSLADYAKKAVPKSVDLPFTKAARRICSTLAPCRPDTTSVRPPPESPSITPRARCASRCRRHASCRSTSRASRPSTRSRGSSTRSRPTTATSGTPRRARRWRRARCRRTRWTAPRNTRWSCSRRSSAATATRW